MKSRDYRERKPKLFREGDGFLTREISIRGFTREFKRALLGDKADLQEQEYEKVADAFHRLWDRRHSEEVSFIGSSGFSKWWKGQTYPGSDWRERIDKLFPGLSQKWFDRTKFSNRLQMHLASMDLFHLSRDCICKEKIKLDDAGEGYCQKCLSQAVLEAERILFSIHADWEPTKIGFKNIHDLCISGPEERAGNNPVMDLVKWLLHEKSSESANDKMFPLGRKSKWQLILNEVKSYFDTDIKAQVQAQRHNENLHVWNSIKDINTQDVLDDSNISYDLSLGATSFVGVPLPKKIVKVHQVANPLSIIPFLLILLCLDLRALKGDYRDDLILDFMSALNCGCFLLEAGAINDSVDSEERILQLFMYVSEYFYRESPDIDAEVVSYEEAYGNREMYGSSIIFRTPPESLIGGHYAYRLTQVFLDLVDSEYGEREAEYFISSFSDDSRYTNKKSVVDDYLNTESARVFKSLQSARERYLKQFYLTGLTEIELQEKLDKVWTRPTDAAIFSTHTGPMKESVYS